MFCHYCGTEIRNNELFCRNCGTRQEPAAEVEAPAVIPMPVIEPTPVQEPTPIAPAVEDIPAPRPATEYKEKTFDWQPYGAPVKEEALVDLGFNRAPKLQLPVKRSLAKMFFLGMLTLGIYPIVIWSRLVSEVNIVASRYDGKRSMSFFGMLLLSPFTLGIHSIIWTHNLCSRMGDELRRRSISYSFGAKDYWLWAFLLSALGSVFGGVFAVLTAMGIKISILAWVLPALGVLTIIGPFVFVAKMMRAINALNKDFNING